MANEIQVGPGTPLGSFEFLFYYPIPVGQRILARDSAGATNAAVVVPTPASSAPSWAKLTAAETTALDTGAATIRTEQMTQMPAESEADFRTRVQARYASLTLDLLADYTAKYRHLNKRFNAS